MNKLIHGDCLEVMRGMDAGSIQMCVTSPPYWGLRDYGVAGQFGLDNTPEEYVDKLVALFAELRRVIRDDGTLWLVIGDSYASKTKGSGGKSSFQPGNTGSFFATPIFDHGLKDKDLVGIPWRVAFALQKDGWYLRQDIIWHKPNPMPESITDRCTKSHEYIFLLSKSKQYYYDADAIKENLTESSIKRNQTGWDGNKYRDLPGGAHNNFDKYLGSEKAKLATHRNKRSVWTLTTKPYTGAHSATFPPGLIKPCILAGCPEGGTVLDPFMGAGTTAIVCHTLGREWLGIELNQEYIEIAEKRIFEHTRQLNLFRGADAK